MLIVSECPYLVSNISGKPTYKVYNYVSLHLMWSYIKTSLTPRVLFCLMYSYKRWERNSNTTILRELGPSCQLPKPR